MSKARSQLEKATQELTGQLPDLIKLTRSQSLSLIALNQDDARMNQQITQGQRLIDEAKQAQQAGQIARLEVLAEIANGAGVQPQQIAENYQLSTDGLIRAR